MNIRVQSNPSSAHCHQPGGGVSLLIQHDFSNLISIGSIVLLLKAIPFAELVLVFNDDFHILIQLNPKIEEIYTVSFFSTKE